jgi:hypothetical protein
MNPLTHWWTTKKPIISDRLAPITDEKYSIYKLTPLNYLKVLKLVFGNTIIFINLYALID